MLSLREHLDDPLPRPAEVRDRKRVVMARTASAVFAAEGMLVLGATLIRNGLDARELPALILVVGAFLLAVAVLVGRGRLGRAPVHLAAITGAVMIGALVYSQHELFGVLSVLLVFFVTSFLHWRSAAVHVAWMLAILAAALNASLPGAEAAEGLVLCGGVMLGAFGLVLALRRELTQLVQERTDALARERADRALIDVLFASAPVGIAQFDRDLRYVRVNETLAAANGLAAGDQVGRTLRDVLPHLADDLEPLMREILRTGSPALDVETASPDPGDPGRLRYHRSSRYPLRGPSGDVVGVGVIVDDVTELREAQAELERSLASQSKTTAILDAVLAGAPVGVALIDRDLRYVHVNDTVYEMHGLAPSDFLGRTFGEVFPGLVDDVQPRLERVLATGEPQIGEEELVSVSRKTGVERHWIVSRYPVRDAAGDVLGVASILTDVSELLQTRDALESALAGARADAAVLDALFADAPVGIVVFDRDCRYVRVNDTYATWTKTTVEEHLGRRVGDLDPVIGAQIEPVMRKVLETGVAAVGVEATRGDGRTFRSSRYPIRDERGDVVGIATIVDDVTGLKDAERRIEAALSAERQSRAFLDSLLDNAPLGLTYADRDLRYRVVNRVAAEVSGLSPDDMVGRTVAEVYPELAHVLVPAMTAVLESGERLVGQEIQDTDPVTGATRHWLVSRFPMHDGDGEVIGVASLRTEVTAMKALEQQLEQMLATESSARVQVEQARLELARIASTDTLTGLANRRLFSEHLELALARSRRYGTVVSILYLDLDGFKAVNDALGHEGGDALLCEVANVLRVTSRDTDLVARLGGDEFLVLLADLPPHEAEEVALGVAERLVERVARVRADVTTSIGAAFAPRDGVTERDLLARADAEMYRHKRGHPRAA